MNINELHNPWEVLENKRVYENPWIAIEDNKVLNPSGGVGIYGKVFFKNKAIGILVLDEDYNTWMVGQYRFPIEKYSWEIPEGGGPHESSYLDSAKRELKEETGIIAQKWTHLLEMDISNSVTNEASVTYIAQGLSFGESEPEEVEQLVIKKMPFTKVYNMVMNGEIRDSITVASVLKAKILIDKGDL
ncbi:MAG: NUDIX hydrolase [Ichthyobacteriaceae bacterium]|nr:NUDIX hydrolase [Ichthyobacteriaceae bacterium]